MPACSPQLARGYAFRKPADLLKAPLLHVVSRPDSWEQWLRVMRVEVEDVQGMLVDQFAVATQAAIAGLGVAPLPTFLIDTELAGGDLKVAIDRPMERPDCYYLAWPLAREDHPPLQASRAWLQQAASSLPAPSGGERCHRIDSKVA